MSSQIQITPERTPNPQSMKFNVNVQLLAEPINFVSSREAERSPLASKLFGFPWTAGVYIGNDFITITKQDWVEWEMLAEPLAGLLKEHFDSNEPLLNDAVTAPPSTENEILADDSPVVQAIKTVINTEIRPAVAMDGGDIVFHKYEDRIVYIYMRGSCAGCPSSTATLKQGIEVRLKEAIPEILEVQAL
jgi:Fe-S cluster biogenesis protein NfuA